MANFKPLFKLQLIKTASLLVRVRNFMNKDELIFHIPACSWHVKYFITLGHIL